MLSYDEKPGPGPSPPLEKTVTNEVDDNEPSSNESDPSFYWDVEIILNLLACFLTFFTSVLATLVPSGAIGFIVRSFPDEASSSIWISAAFTVTSCTVQAFCGDLSDKLGRKAPLLAGMLLGIAGMLLGGRASSLNMVIAGQVLSGAGATLGFLCVPIFQEIVPKEKRPMIMSVSGVFAGTAYSTGSIISGAFIKGEVGGPNNGWRCGFYLCACCYAIAFVLLAIFYHPGPRSNPEGLPMSSLLWQIDWLGVFLVAAGLSIFLVGLQSGGNPIPWISARVLACVIVGVGTLIMFCLWEWKGNKNGILTHELFGHRNFAVTLAISFVGGMVLFGGQTFLPQEIIYLFTDDAVLTGVWAIPFNTGTVLGSIAGGVWLSHSKEAKPIVICTFVLLTLGAGLMLVVKPGINFAGWFFPTGIMGVAVGIQTTVLQVVVTLCTPDHLIAAAVSIQAAARSLGGSIVVVIFSQIFNSKAKTLVPKEIMKSAIQAGLPQSSAEALVTATQNGQDISGIPGITPDVLAIVTAAVRSGYSASFKFVWYALIPFAVVGMGISFLLQSTDGQMTKVVASAVKRRKEHRGDPEQS